MRWSTRLPLYGATLVTLRRRLQVATSTEPVTNERQVESKRSMERCMKLFIGKPDETNVLIAEQVSGNWQVNPNLTADMTKFLVGADPEQFDMWVEEPE
jgi:hypothetical protein